MVGIEAYPPRGTTGVLDTLCAIKEANVVWVDSTVGLDLNKDSRFYSLDPTYILIFKIACTMDSDLEKNSRPLSGSTQADHVAHDLESRAPTVVSHTPDPQLHHQAIASKESLPVRNFSVNFRRVSVTHAHFFTGWVARSRRQNRGYKD